MSDFQLKTPVAFIIFNRQDTTERVFAEIAKAKPPKLLVVGDGPRPNRKCDADGVAATRAIINRVDWDCEVLTNFSDINLGCKQRVSSGIDWVFEQVEHAIILEDDCLPHPTFFRFCEELLGRFRNDHRISQISGVNFQFGHQINDDSYYFSKYSNIWGWASWRDRWQNSYDVDMKDWPRIKSDGRMADWFCSQKEEKYFFKIYNAIWEGKLNTWDYQWGFANRLNGRLSVIPNVNMISNIGFGADATHTTSAGMLSNMPAEEMRFPVKHPQGMFACQTLDRRFFNRFCLQTLSRRVKAKVRQLVRAKPV